MLRKFLPKTTDDCKTIINEVFKRHTKGMTMAEAIKDCGMTYDSYYNMLERFDMKGYAGEKMQKSKDYFSEQLEIKAKKVLLQRLDGVKKVTTKKIGSITPEGKIVPVKAEITETIEYLSDSALLRILQDTDPGTFGAQKVDITSGGMTIPIAPIIILPPDDGHDY